MYDISEGFDDDSDTNCSTFFLVHAKKQTESLKEFFFFHM